jgi:predicted nucleotide-binding protein
MRILDQQLVAHVFAAADGPDAEAAHRAVDEIWRGCGRIFRMTESIPGANLPRLLSPGLASLPAGSETALAAQESPDGNFQAVLRIHHDVLNLSIALAMPERPAGEADRGAENWTWWRDLDNRWHRLTDYAAPHLLGEARLYLARVADNAGIAAATPALYRSLSRLLPAEAVSSQDTESAGVSLPAGSALWETATQPDGRRLRRFVLATAPDADAAASAWAWSDGGTRIPPLCRYLLHAAKIRYELRVWQRDGQARQLRSSLDGLGEELRRLGASDPAKRELLRVRRLDALLEHTDLRGLRRTVEIAADNLGRAFDLTGLLGPGSPFADDAGLARSMLEWLDDEITYLDQAAERAQLTGAMMAPGGTAGPAGRSGPRLEPGTGDAVPARPVPAGEAGEDLRRKVFVVYGRDGQAERAIFDFLRAIDLHPLEWEQVVKQTGKMAPSLAESVRTGLAGAHAVVVLLTPDDVVSLHPDLHGMNETSAETGDSMQARPNVLLELGMALMSHPNTTLVLMAGEQRPVTDLGGINFVKITDTVDCRQKIAARLQAAGCRVDLHGNHWHTAGDFGGLAALRRRAPASSSRALTRPLTGS